MTTSLQRFVQKKKKAFLLSWYRRKLKAAMSISTHLTLDERICLFRLSKGRSNICEIGSYLGASACCFGASRSSDSEKIVCIDTWENHSMTEGNRDTWSEFQVNTSKYRKYIQPVRGFSADVAQVVKDTVGNIDLLFIDGDHSYDGVLSDWLSYKDLLSPNALVIFHDYGWAEGVQRVVDESVAPSSRSHGRLPNMWWGVIG